MIRFTIRDVLWATLVVAVLFGWFVHIRVKDRQRDELYEEKLRIYAKENDWLRGSLELYWDKERPGWRNQMVDGAQNPPP